MAPPPSYSSKPPGSRSSKSASPTSVGAFSESGEDSFSALPSACAGGEAEGGAGGEAEAPVWASLDDEARETPSRTPSKTPNHEPKTNLLEPAVGESEPFRALPVGSFVDGVLIVTECSQFSKFLMARWNVGIAVGAEGTQYEGSWQT